MEEGRKERREGTWAKSGIVKDLGCETLVGVKMVWVEEGSERHIYIGGITQTEEELGEEEKHAVKGNKEKDMSKVMKNMSGKYSSGTERQINEIKNEGNETWVKRTWGLVDADKRHVWDIYLW